MWMCQLKWAYFIFIWFIKRQISLYMWRIPIIDDVLCQFVLQSVTFQLKPQLRETTDQRSLVAKFGHLNDVRTPAAYNVSIGVATLRFDILEQAKVDAAPVE